MLAYYINQLNFLIQCVFLYVCVNFETHVLKLVQGKFLSEFLLEKFGCLVELGVDFSSFVYRIVFYFSFTEISSGVLLIRGG